MKKFRKNSKGMTLVEVIVAITIFSIMAIGIMTALGTSMLQTNKSARRDIEVGEQAQATAQKSSTKLNAVVSDSTSYTINYGALLATGASNPTDVKYMQADGAQFNSTFEFNLKTFGNINDFSDASDLSINVSASTTPNDYKILFKNTSDKAITLYAELTNGYIFEGNPNMISGKGYVHSSKRYVKTSENQTERGEIQFGYHNDSFSTGDIKIWCIDASGSYVLGQMNLNPSTDFTDNVLTVTYDGTNIQLS